MTASFMHVLKRIDKVYKSNYYYYFFCNKVVVVLNFN